MKKFFMSALLVCLTSACAHGPYLVQKRYGEDKGGLINYRNTLIHSDMSDKAQDLAHNYCNGPWQPVQETNIERDNRVWVQMDFKCL